jgi:hypothetical protein
VTCNLAAVAKRADDSRGGGGTDKCRGRGSNSLVVKILTSKLFDIKILQILFADPAPVKAFGGSGEGGYPRNPDLSGNEDSLESGARRQVPRYLFSEFPQTRECAAGVGAQPRGPLSLRDRAGSGASSLLKKADHPPKLDPSALP